MVMGVNLGWSRMFAWLGPGQSIPLWAHEFTSKVERPSRAQSLPPPIPDFAPPKLLVRLRVPRPAGGGARAVLPCRPFGGGPPARPLGGPRLCLRTCRERSTRRALHLRRGMTTRRAAAPPCVWGSVPRCGGPRLGPCHRGAAGGPRALWRNLGLQMDLVKRSICAEEGKNVGTTIGTKLGDLALMASGLGSSRSPESARCS